MVICGNCGFEAEDDLKNCPNCGSNLVKSDVEGDSSSDDNILKCSNCGGEINSNDEFCHNCGNKIENNVEVLKCGDCGSELPENTLFCPTCGSKVNFPEKIVASNNCPNCGSPTDINVDFCPECGTNIKTGDASKYESNSTSFLDKIDLKVIVKPTLIALIASVILSLIGLFIGFSWLSFVIAIILSVGFFAGLIDNGANAIVSGLIVGLILGILEYSLVEFMFGGFVAGFYEGFFGGHLILLIILGIIIAYISNTFLKDTIRDIAKKFVGML